MTKPNNPEDITAELVRSRFVYDPEIGNFYHRHAISNVKAGQIAGSKDTEGYVQLWINGAPRLAHRVAWLYVHGVWPTERIDHRNFTRDDNRIKNLREATFTENQQHQRKYKNNRSGFPGVSWNTSARKWRAHISVDNKMRYLGSFDCPVLASSAYQNAKAEHHPFSVVAESAEMNQ